MDLGWSREKERSFTSALPWSKCEGCSKYAVGRIGYIRIISRTQEMFGMFGETLAPGIFDSYSDDCALTLVSLQ